jgi:hypothetical protein
MARRRQGSDHKLSIPSDAFSRAVIRSETRRASTTKSRQVPEITKNIRQQQWNKREKERLQGTLHRNISQMDSTIPMRKESHSSRCTIWPSDLTPYPQVRISVSQSRKICWPCPQQASPGVSSRINDFQGPQSLANIPCIDKKSEEVKQFRSRTYRQEMELDHDPTIHQHAHAGSQAERRKQRSQKPHSSQKFHKRKVFTASTSPLTGSRAKYN